MSKIFFAVMALMLSMSFFSVAQAKQCSSNGSLQDDCDPNQEPGFWDKWNCQRYGINCKGQPDRVQCLAKDGLNRTYKATGYYARRGNIQMTAVAQCNASSSSPRSCVAAGCFGF